MVCNTEDCAVKCEFCGKILKPPERCSGCGQTTTDLVKRGELEEYILMHREKVIPVKYTGEEWIVVRFQGAATPLPKFKHSLYIAERRVPDEVVEKAIDTIQIYRLYYPDTIQQVLSTHKKKKGRRFHYLITQPVHIEMSMIASNYYTTMQELLTAFIDYVGGGEKYD